MNNAPSLDFSSTLLSLQTFEPSRSWCSLPRPLSPLPLLLSSFYSFFLPLSSSVPHQIRSFSFFPSNLLTFFAFSIFLLIFLFSAFYCLDVPSFVRSNTYLSTNVLHLNVSCLYTFHAPSSLATAFLPSSSSLLSLSKCCFLKRPLFWSIINATPSYPDTALEYTICKLAGLECLGSSEGRRKSSTQPFAAVASDLNASASAPPAAILSLWTILKFLRSRSSLRFHLNLRRILPVSLCRTPCSLLQP